jgi:uncharacterized tellurite resistance protein B-like protein
MLNILKKLISPPDTRGPLDRDRLARAVASLLYELMRMDSHVSEEDRRVARLALVDLLGVDETQARELLEHAGDARNRVTSYHDAVSVINRSFGMDRRCLLVEHLWRVAYADQELHLHEDHLVRKLADLMHVSNTESMLARKRARAKV